jgi:hypothetical protein
VPSGRNRLLVDVHAMHVQGASSQRSSKIACTAADIQCSIE